MQTPMNTISDVLKLGRNITMLPVIHGSGDFAVEVRRLMLTHKFDCLAVPLPPSFQTAVEDAVEKLPVVSVVLQREPRRAFRGTETDFETGQERDDDEGLATASYVPIDPCQPVIAALRIARQERMARAFIEIETDHYVPITAMLPDPYALKRVRPEQFAAAVLPALQPPTEPDELQRIHWMANELHRLSTKHQSVLCVCNIMDWPWLRDAFNSVVDHPNDRIGQRHRLRLIRSLLAR